MAEETQVGESPIVAVPLNINVPDIYSNNSNIIIGGSEVAIAFLQDIGFSGTEPPAPQKALVRIVMTHEVFMNFVTYCNTRAKFIQDAYDGAIPSISNKDRTVEEIEKAYENMRSRKRVVAKFDFSPESDK